jgi:hypothetical protein
MHTKLIGKPDGKRPFGRIRRSLADNFKMRVKGTACEDVDCIEFMSIMIRGCIQNFRTGRLERELQMV